jgi:hypothetical protein
VLGSYMKGHPDELLPWVQKMAPLLGGWIDESKPVSPEDWTDWRNAHAAWNMVAQFDVGTVLGEDGTGPHNQIALDIFSKLVAQDVQGNGAIPGSQQLVNDHLDETWITAYLVYFGMRPLLADMELDAGTGEEAGPPEGGVGDGGEDAGASASPPSSGHSGCGCDQVGAGGSEPLGILMLGLVGASALGRLGRRRLRPSRSRRTDESRPPAGQSRL